MCRISVITSGQSDDANAVAGTGWYEVSGRHVSPGSPFQQFSDVVLEDVTPLDYDYLYLRSGHYLNYSEPQENSI